MKKKTKRGRIQKKQLFQAIVAIVLAIIVIVVVLNAILRTEIQLTDVERSDLELFFPKEHLDSVTVYQDGIAAIGASKALCKNIYLRSKSLTYYDGFGDLGESYKRATLVHEFVHTYQGKTIYGCVDLGVSSLYHQFMSYLRYGSRSYAYVYSPNLSHNVFKENAKDGYNVEQEASIVEDYFFVYYLNESVSHTNCYDCNRTKCYSCTDLHSKEFIVEWLEKESQRILQKYA